MIGKKSDFGQKGGKTDRQPRHMNGAGDSDFVAPPISIQRKRCVCDCSPTYISIGVSGGGTYNTSRIPVAFVCIAKSMKTWVQI